MHRRAVLIGAISTLAPPALAVDVWQLVTPEEVAHDLTAPHRAESRGLPRPGAPSIVVEQPNATGVLHAPLSFRIRFVPEKGVSINPDSFRASYGFLGIDITRRLLEHARLTDQGLTADNVTIPPGDHRVTLAIADTRGRETDQSFSFTVA